MLSPMRLVGLFPVLGLRCPAQGRSCLCVTEQGLPESCGFRGRVRRGGGVGLRVRGCVRSVWCRGWSFMGCRGRVRSGCCWVLMGRLLLERVRMLLLWLRGRVVLFVISGITRRWCVVLMVFK